MAELADYLDLTVGQARQQFRELRRRSPVSVGRQVVFLPVETLLCLAASFLVNHRHFGGSTAHQAPEPDVVPVVPEPGEPLDRLPRLGRVVGQQLARDHLMEHDVQLEAHRLAVRTRHLLVMLERLLHL